MTGLGHIKQNLWRLLQLVLQWPSSHPANSVTTLNGDVLHALNNQSLSTVLTKRITNATKANMHQ